MIQEIKSQIITVQEETRDQKSFVAMLQMKFTA